MGQVSFDGGVTYIRPSSMTDSEIDLFIECLQKTRIFQDYNSFMSRVTSMQQRFCNTLDPFTMLPHSRTDAVKMVINESDNDYIFDRRELVEGTITPMRYNNDYLINYDVCDENNVNISIGVINGED